MAPAGTRSYWREAARALKRALLGGRKVWLGGEHFHLAYEARHVREFPDYAFLMECARDCRCVFDVGANVGATSLVMASHLADDGRLIAFEPSEAAALVIRENARLNGMLDRIDIVNTLVSDRSGTSEVFHWNFVSSRSNSVQARSNESIPMEKVTLSLDGFCKTSNVAPDFVKIDVEGSESRVLEGFARTMQTSRPVVYVELHGWPEQKVGATAARVYSTTIRCDYRMMDIRTKTVIDDPVVHFARVSPPRQSIHSQGRVLLVPCEGRVRNLVSASKIR